MNQMPPLPGNFITLGYLFKSEMFKAFEAKRLGLAVMHFEVLKCIDCSENCTAGTIGQVLRRDKSQINRLLKFMLAEKYISKRLHPGDARVSLLKLTKKGTAALEKLQHEEDQLLAQLKRGLSQKELSEFSRIIEIMRANLCE